LYPHSVVAAFVLYYRVPDYEEMLFIRAYLKSGDLFVDVGANIGVYSLWAAEVEGVDVVAFEPSSTTHPRMLENIHMNSLESRITVLRKAVGSQAGTVAFTTDLDATNSVVAEAAGHSAEHVELVEQTTLDREMAVAARPAIIKIDVEGGELDVLRGARSTILRHRPALLIEVNDPAGLSAVLGDLGYETWSYDAVSNSLSPAVPVLFANVIAVADVDSARSRIADTPPLRAVAPRIARRHATRRRPRSTTVRRK
jgi:FkbM family methyltransferase